MNVAIVEDEAEAADTLERCLARYGREEGEEFSVSRFDNAVDFLEGYRPVYDLVFMDIQMPYLNGMKAAEKLRETDKTVSLIFVTNLMRYAVQGYKVEAADFIVKPIDYSGLKMALTRVRQRMEERHQSKTAVISVSGHKTRLSVDSVLYVEVMGHALTYHTLAGNFQSYGSLTEVKKTFTPEDGFCNISNSFLVNLRHVKRVEGNDAYVGDEVLQISFRKRKEFVQALDEYRGRGGGRG